MRRDRRLPLETLAPYLLEVKEGRLDWPALFGNSHPVEIEVGFGKGMFLVSAATSRPERNFLGIEIARKLQLYTAARLARRNLRNVRVACGDAYLLFRDRVADASVETVHVYFPDPWWKQRHRKRRIFSANFAAEVERVLMPGGFLRLATDVEEYFAVITGILAQHPRLERLPAESPHDPQHDLDYLTNFERKYRKEGRPIYRVAHRKV